jgi:hypothetical protein
VVKQFWGIVIALMLIPKKNPYACFRRQIGILASHRSEAANRRGCGRLCLKTTSCRRSAKFPRGGGDESEWAE